MNASILLDHEPVADGGYLVRALLRVTGDAPPASDRPPLDLALVLDRSGSMHAAGKLDRARDAAALLVRRLADTDTISIIAYDDGVETIAARAPGARRDELIQRIAAIQPGGSTNLSGGWLRGRELVAEGIARDGAAASKRASPAAQPGAPPATIRRVILLTDGLANVGIIQPGQLRDLVASGAAAGIATTTIGFGEDYDEVLLRDLADAGRGNTYYIEAPDQAPAVFEAEIQGLMALAAQNVAITVAPTAATQVAAVHHPYPSHAQDDGSLRLELGDLYALEPRSLLVEFLSSDEDAAEVDVATLTLEAHVLLPGGGIEKRTLTLPIRVDRAAAAVVNPELRRELLLLEAARAREDALEDRARGAFQEGARKLRGVAEKLAARGDLDDTLLDEMEDLQDMAERMETEQLSAADRKWMYQRAYSRSSSNLRSSAPLMDERAAERKRRRGE